MDYLQAKIVEIGITCTMYIESDREFWLYITSFWHTYILYVWKCNGLRTFQTYNSMSKKSWPFISSHLLYYYFRLKCGNPSWTYSNVRITFSHQEYCTWAVVHLIQTLILGHTVGVSHCPPLIQTLRRGNLHF